MERRNPEGCWGLYQGVRMELLLCKGCARARISKCEFEFKWVCFMCLCKCAGLILPHVCASEHMCTNVCVSIGLRVAVSHSHTCGCVHLSEYAVSRHASVCLCVARPCVLVSSCAACPAASVPPCLLSGGPSLRSPESLHTFGYQTE